MTPTHHGLFLGIAPVWVDMTNPDSPCIEAKGGAIGEYWLDFVEGIFGMCCMLMVWLNPEYVPVFPMYVRPI